MATTVLAVLFITACLVMFISIASYLYACATFTRNVQRRHPDTWDELCRKGACREGHTFNTQKLIMMYIEVGGDSSDSRFRLLKLTYRMSAISFLLSVLLMLAFAWVAK